MFQLAHSVHAARSCIVAHRPLVRSSAGPCLRSFRVPRNARLPYRTMASANNGASPSHLPEKKDVKNSASTVPVQVDELRSLCVNSLKTLGYSEDEVQVVVEVLLYAQLRGNNQGIIKITTGGLNRAASATDIVVEHETRLSALLNGGNQLGMLVLHRAMELAVSKAKTHGFGVVGTNHTFTSTGALGYWAEAIGQQGLIALVMSQSPEFVAPYGAKQAVFGTNPIAISVPSSSGPVTMDMATSAYAWFGLLEAKTAGRPIPPDVAYNSRGEPTTDPSEVLEGGAIRVFDRSYKGSNLALMVELLAGPLVGAAVADKLEEKNWGNLVVALDPSLLGDKETIKQRTQMVLDRVKGAARLPGVSEIMLPGERGDRLATERLRSGVIPVEANLYNQLKVMASKYETATGVKGDKGPKRKLATQLLHPKTSLQDPYKATGPPLYQTATFAQPSGTTYGEYDYTRSGNPTRTFLEEQYAALEGADRALAFTSGMAAIAAVTKLVKAGEHIVAGDDIYGGTSRLLANVVPNAGIAVSNVDMTSISQVRSAIIPGKTKLVIVESPTNPRMQICDIRAIASLAHNAGALCMVDNSFMTPLFQRPLDLGADISMVSGTKFIGGHSDVTCGLLAIKGVELGKKLYFLQNAEGAGLAPFDCWLAARGLKTMALRMEKQQSNAEKIAHYLQGHPLVKKMNYSGLKGHLGHDLHYRQASGSGSVLSFETGNVEASKVIVESTQLFKVTVSFGNVTSQISLPCYMSHASIPAEVRAARGLPDDLVRISCGIEDADDLIADLDEAMSKAMAVAGAVPAAAQGSSAPRGNGSSPGGQLSSAREEELLQRIQQLEEQLQQASV